MINDNQIMFNIYNDNCYYCNNNKHSACNSLHTGNFYPGGDASDGCTDPTACNYNPFAANDDGSCTYPTDMSIYDIQYTLNQG